MLRIQILCRWKIRNKKSELPMETKIGNGDKNRGNSENFSNVKNSNIV